MQLALSFAIPTEFKGVARRKKKLLSAKNWDRAQRYHLCLTDTTFQSIKHMIYKRNKDHYQGLILHWICNAWLKNGLLFKKMKWTHLEQISTSLRQKWRNILY